MFGKTRETRIETLIGPALVVRGDVEFTGGLHLDGHITGSLRAVDQAGSKVAMTEGAVVEGELVAGEASIDGTVRGNVSVAGHLSLGPHARVDGDVRCATLEIALGARISGKMFCSARGAAPAAGGAGMA